MPTTRPSDEWEWINYGAKQQLTKPHDDPPYSTQLGSNGFKALWALDSTMLTAIGSISSAQANSTKATAKDVAHLATRLLCHTS
eukprot:scaffold103920_cov55-Attheya_sp.AAC.2